MGNKPGAKLRAEDRAFFNQHTTFNADEVSQWFKAFYKDCPNGYLTLQDFQQIYAQYFPGGNSTSFANQVFRQFDLNNDGMVTFREFLIGLNITSRKSAREKIQWAFHLYDTDRDGFISREEMLQVVKSIYEMVGPTMQMPDDESTPQQRTDKIFNQYDRDRDGKLSFDEFLQGALADPAVGRLLGNEAAGGIAAMASSLSAPSSRTNPSSTSRLQT